MKTALKVVAAGAAVAMIAGPVSSVSADNGDNYDYYYDLEYQCEMFLYAVGTGSDGMDPMLKSTEVAALNGGLSGNLHDLYVHVCGKADVVDEAISLACYAAEESTFEGLSHSIFDVPVPKDLHDAWVEGTCVESMNSPGNG